MSRLRAAIELLQSQGAKGAEVTLNMGRVFLLIAENPGLCQKDILNYLDFSPGNIARVVAALCDGSPKKQGLKLITTSPSPYDWRSSQYSLAKRGVELAARLKNL